MVRFKVRDEDILNGKHTIMAEKAIIEADAKEVADKILSVARAASNEAELAVNIEHILKNVLTRLGIANYASYEFRTGKGTLVEGTGRIDALYGRVVIEYESPGTFESASGFNHAKEQVIGYIKQLVPAVEAWQKYFGVVLDGYQIGFVRFRKNWVSDGPYPVNERTILTFLESLRGLRRLALRVELLNKHLGAGSSIAKTLVKVLYETLIKNKEHHRVKVLFNDWKRVFGQVCGYSPEKIKGLEQAYGLSANEIDYEGLLFAVHTYYALVMKLLAAEVAVASADSYLQSYLKKFETAYYHGHEKLRSMLRDVEEGDIFARAIGIKNFLEGDYFGWYLDVWDEHLEEAVSKLAKTLSEFEPATLEHEPEEVKDLLKRLYQYLVPKKIRHDLGEYYTPDWLAELVISEVGYDGNLDKRFLDPACGSGTFLVLAIKKARRYALDNFRDETETLEGILKNIVGFDLNPLAVLAARTNYLIALGKLIKYKREEIEIPVYFADSILVERKQTLYGSYAYSLKTEAGEFQIPIGVVRKGLLPRVLAVVEDCVKPPGCSEDVFEERVKKEVLRSGAKLNKNEIYILNGLFQEIVDLEQEGRNRIWTRILKNSFAPLLQNKFDYVVGNPPWVNWENLPENYRNGTKELWEDYKLFTLSGMEARLGGGKKDISILFAYRCLDRYLKERGNFGFLITQSVFKTKGAGEGFRRFKIAEKKEGTIKEVPVNVVKVHDLVELNPFEGASNRTAAIFIKKQGETIYPVTYKLWKRKKRARIDQKDSLEEASEKSTRIELLAYPSDETNVLSPWLTLPEEVINIVKKMQGKNHYRTYAGIYSGGANAVYWLYILGVASRRKEKIESPAYLRTILRIQAEEIEIKDIVVENITEGMKKGVEKISPVAIEDFFVFPLIKTQHLKKWKLQGYIYTLQMQDPMKRIGYDEQWVKINFPKTYRYLKSLEDVIRKRSSGVVRQLMEKGPFYSMYAVGEYTFSPYKVVWNQMGSELNACVISSVNDEFLGEKMILPEHVLAFVPTDNENEAHFICALLNSRIVDLAVRSIAGGTKSFGTPKIIEETIRIPRFDTNNENHVELAELSKKAHEFALKEREEELREVEEEVDKEVADLFGLTEEELGEVKEALRVVYGEGAEAEGEVEEEAAGVTDKETPKKRRWKTL